MRRVQTMKISRVSLAIFLVVFAALTSSPAQALELISADPAANSTIKSAPGAITLTLSSEIIETGSSMSVRAPSGSAVDDGSLLIDGVQALLAHGSDQVEKEDPQPQVLVAFGFLITNCAPCRSSL